MKKIINIVSMFLLLLTFSDPAFAGRKLGGHNAHHKYTERTGSPGHYHYEGDSGYRRSYRSGGANNSYYSAPEPQCKWIVTQSDLSVVVREKDKLTTYQNSCTGENAAKIIDGFGGSNTLFSLGYENNIRVSNVVYVGEGNYILLISQNNGSLERLKVLLFDGDELSLKKPYTAWTQNCHDPKNPYREEYYVSLINQPVTPNNYKGNDENAEDWSASFIINKIGCTEKENLKLYEFNEKALNRLFTEQKKNK